MDELLEALVEGFVALHADDPALHRVLASEAPVSAALRARLAALRETAISLAERASQGVTASPRISATVIVDAADALTHRWIVDETGADLTAEALTRELCTMFRAYLGGASGGTATQLQG